MEQIQYKLDVFEGPLDLLLFLISKHKLNINDIPILELVEQYIEYVRKMDASDMDIASEFVEMAARLVYIKTVSLLPVHEEAEKLRQDLIGELIEYRDCKEVAKKLSTQTDGFDCFEREPMKIERDLTYKRKHDATELVKYLTQAIGRTKNKIPLKAETFGAIVTKTIVSVSSRISFIYERLNKKSKLPFSELFSESTSISQMVATFLALLEMVKEKQIKVDGELDTCTISLGTGSKINES